MQTKEIHSEQQQPDNNHQEKHNSSFLSYQADDISQLGCFEGFDFSLKPVDTFEYVSQLPRQSSQMMNHSQILGINTNYNGELQNSQHSLFQFELSQINSLNAFSLSAQNSLGLAKERSIFLSHNDEDMAQESYDFMNLYPENNNQSGEDVATNLFNMNDRFVNHNISDSRDAFVSHKLEKFIPESIYPAIQEESHSEAQLLRMSDFDRMLPEMEFEPFSEEEQRQIREQNSQRLKEGKALIAPSDRYGGSFIQVAAKVIEKKKRRDYDKNICRYIVRQMMRCFISEEYHSLVKERFCAGDDEKLENCVNYIKKELPGISGHRTFKELLIHEKDAPKNEYKIIFRNYAKWFLKERSFRYIMLGAAEDKTQYIRYKNQVILHFINRPEKWNANLRIRSDTFRVRSANALQQSQQQQQQQQYTQTLMADSPSKSETNLDLSQF